MQDKKNLRDVVLEQIENTVLKSDKEPLREEAARHSKAINNQEAQSSSCCGQSGDGGSNGHQLLPGRR